ncbi:hypothetical protein [Erwinia sp. ErVv1]|nr:hypothetical protein [Erwinia sp. ErVv1]
MFEIAALDIYSEYAALSWLTTGGRTGLLAGIDQQEIQSYNEETADG